MATTKRDSKNSSSSSKKKVGKTYNPIFDNFHFEPKTQTQAEAILDFESGKNLILSGFAGTGKTYLALALALREVIEGRSRKIQIFRSAVCSRDIGFLPGTEEEKMQVYEKAIKFLVNKLLKRDDAWDCLKYMHVVHFASTSFERGVSYDDTIVIVDEFQNLSSEEISTLVTRIGKGSRIIFSGDTRQCDLPRHQSGFEKLVRISDKLSNWFGHQSFGTDDVLRSPFVKAWLIAEEDDYLTHRD